MSLPSRPSGAFSSWEIGLALRYLRAKRKEGGVATIAVISFIGIMLAVAVLISVMSIMSGFRSELLGRMLAFNGHMYVQGQVLTSPDREAALKRIQAVPGVASASPLNEAQSLIRVGSYTTGAIAKGIRPEDLAKTQYVFDSLSPQERASFGKGPYGGDRILVGAALANSMGLRVGDPVTLYSPTGADSAFGNLGGLEKTYFVGGLFRSGAADYDRAFIFMPLEQQQLFFGKEGVWDAIEIKVDDPDQVGALTAAIRDAAGPGSVVSDWRERLAAFYGALKVERVAMSIILGLVVAIAAMNIISGIVMLVKNKGRDIAILRTIGQPLRDPARLLHGRRHDRGRGHHRGPDSGAAVLLEHRFDPAFPGVRAADQAVRFRRLYAGRHPGPGRSGGRDLGGLLVPVDELYRQPAAVLERVSHRSRGGASL